MSASEAAVRVAWPRGYPARAPWKISRQRGPRRTGAAQLVRVWAAGVDVHFTIWHLDTGNLIGDDPTEAAARSEILMDESSGSSPLAVPIPRDLLARISDHKATPRVDETVQVWSASTAPRKRMPRSLVWNRSV